MRNFVVCCGGTWNTPEQREEVVPVPTNVLSAYRWLGGSYRDGPDGGDHLFLYGFANDAWHFYDNNRGSVRLTVRRRS